MSIDAAKTFQRVVQPPASGMQPIHHRRTYAAQAILGHLSLYLGPVTANTAMTGCCRALGREPESVEPRDVPLLLAALRPMLGTLLGNSSCRILLNRIERDVAS